MLGIQSIWATSKAGQTLVNTKQTMVCIYIYYIIINVLKCDISMDVE